MALAISAIEVIAVVGCSKSQDPQPQAQSSYSEYTIELGERLNNPYLLETMQAALEELVREAGAQIQVPELAATHLYVRFLPKAEEDLETLWNLGEELYLYPLDYEIKQWGLYYMDPSLGEDDYPYVYAVVPADFVFPRVQYEVLAKCYIPDLSDSTVEGTSVSGYDLELRAFEPLLRNQGTNSKAMDRVGGTVSPRGCVMVDTTGQGKFAPLRGARVRCRTFLREAEAVLSDEGVYSFNEGECFIMEPTYSIVYTNEKGFSLWYNLLAGAVDASVDVDRRSMEGFDIKISLTGNSQADSVNFALAAINNSICDYLDTCEAESILPPPADLKVWVMSFMGSSSASMVRRVVGLGEEEVKVMLEKLVDFAARETTLPKMDKEIVVPILQKLLKLCEGLLPDLTIGANTRDYSYGRFYTVTWHELTHSSHFSLIGPEVWKTYIHYILDYGCYGDGSALPDKKGLCDLGESWAYANEHYCGKQFGREWDTCLDSEWFFPHYKQLDDILCNGKKTRAQMYQHLKKAAGRPCLTFEEYWEELK